MTESELRLPRVAAEEAAASYRAYIEGVPDGFVARHLQAQSDEVQRLCGGLPDTDAMFRYAEGKWTVKEVLGHITDAERVFAYRLLRIGRGDTTDLPGFDENAYVPAGEFNQRSIGDLVSEFALQRASTVALVHGMPAAAWPRVGTANGFPITARALVYVIVGHTNHHLKILRERYLPAQK